MNHRNGPFLLIGLTTLLLAGSLYAQDRRIPNPLVTGQAARSVLGQTNFSNITGGTSQTLWGAISGIAIAGNKLIVADTSYLAPPNNNRILIYNDFSSVKARRPQDDLPLADVVLGQPDFASSTAGTTSQLFNQPVGVASDGTRLFIADWGNNRILIYNKIPETNATAPDVVVGQSDFNSAAFGAGPQNLRRPNNASSDGTRLFVADTLNNRVLIFNKIPTANKASADVVVGQPNFNGSTKLPTSASTLSSPVSVTTDGQRLIVTDLVNNRVLIYNSIPAQNGAPADVVVGQPNFTSNGAGNTESTLDFPRYAYSDGTRLLIVDTGNNRILIYNQIPTQNGVAADIVIGQNDFLGLMEACASSNFAIPFAVASDGDTLFVSDSFNRRIMGFRPGVVLINQNGVLNAASLSTAPQTEACQVTLPQPPVAPGSVSTIYGTNFTDQTLQVPSYPLPTTLGGVRVKFNGFDAPIFSVSPTQITVQVPFEVTGYSASVEVEKTTSAGTVVSAATPVGLADGAPGLYSQDGSGAGPGIVYHSADSTPVTADSPAKPGENLIVYATGLGNVSQPVPNGQAASFGAMGSVTIGGTPGVGQSATIVVQGVPYTYTTVTGDSLDQVTTNLATIINNGDPLVSATADIANEKVNLVARTPGADGTNVSYSAFVPSGSTLTVSLGSPVAVPGFIAFGGTAKADQIITVTLGGVANYTYVTTAADTIESIINNLVSQINGDVNVAATADIPNSKILLSLQIPNSGVVVAYTVDVEPAGSTITAVTDSPHLTPGVSTVINTVTATIGKGLPLVPGSIFFGGTAEPGQSVTVMLSTTPYTYTTVAGDTLASVVTNLTALLNGDPNVTATADLTNAKIDLALKNSAQTISFQVTGSGGTSMIVFPQSATSTASESASVVFSGLLPGSVGLYEVMFTVPSDQKANPAADLSLTQNLIVFGSVTSTNIVSNYVSFPIQP